MRQSNYTIVGELPSGYGEIRYAWFPTNEACEKYGLPSFEGYLSLIEAIECNIATSETPGLWTLVPVDGVEDCTIYV